MTTTLYTVAPVTKFSAAGYDIVQAGTVVPDGVVNAIQSAAFGANVTINTSAGGAPQLVQVPSYYNGGTGAPTGDSLPPGAEVKDSTGAVFEKKSDGTWVSAQSGTFAPLTQAGQEQLRNQNALAMVSARAALANAANAPFNWYAIGDSLSEGEGSNGLSKRWMNVVLAQLRARFQPAGVAGGVGFLPVRYATGASGPAAPCVINGTATGSPFVGLGGRGCTLSGAATLTYTVTGTSVDVAWAQVSGGGTLGISIDGGTVQNVATAAGSFLDYRLTRVSLGAQGSHTVTLSAVSGTSYIGGIVVYNQDETSGVRLFDAAHFGYSAVGYLSSVGAAEITAQCAQIQPQLVTLELLGNDYLHNETFTSSQSSLTSIITAIRAGCTVKPTIILNAAYLTNYGGTPPRPWSDYVNYLYQLAITDGDMAVCDMTLRMPPVLGDTRGLYFDAAHPNTKGHALYGTAMANFITG